MKKGRLIKLRRIFWLFVGVLAGCQSQQVRKENYIHPIPFQPKNYVCYKTNAIITIDGQLDEPIWQQTNATDDFVDIQGNLKPSPTFKTNVKMLWDEDYFYFGVYLEEPHIWGNLTERDAVIFQDNDFEIFIDPDGDTHHYYEFEINALNTVWDLLLLRPYREDNQPKVVDSWDIQGLQSATFVSGTLNNGIDIDSFWTVEVAIPFEVLQEMTPKNYFPSEGVQWRINFSRVNWHTEWKDGQYIKKKTDKGKNLPEENWVWSPQGYIAMHAPETWGIVQFSDKIIGKGTAPFKHNQAGKIKWALRQLYYQQRQYFQKYNRYAGNLGQLTLPKVAIDDYQFTPQLFLTFEGYELIAADPNRSGAWLIRADGKISWLPAHKLLKK